MLLQWLITAVLVLACFAYAVKALWPKVQQVKSGCGSCHGCEHSARPQGRAQADFQPVVFHPRRVGKFKDNRPLAPVDIV